MKTKTVILNVLGVALAALNCFFWVGTVFGLLKGSLPVMTSLDCGNNHMEKSEAMWQQVMVGAPLCVLILLAQAYTLRQGKAKKALLIAFAGIFVTFACLTFIGVEPSCIT